MRIVIKLVIVFVLVVGLAVYWFFSQVAGAFSGTYRRVELVSADGEKLYIKTHNWGVTGDYQMTVIASDSEREFEIDSSRQIIFNGLKPFLYRVSNDTLFLTLEKRCRIPEGFNSAWIIVQNEVDQEAMKDSRRDHELRGI